MASTRQPAPLQIFQDPVPSAVDHPGWSQIHPAMPPLAPLGSIRNAPSRRDVIFNPPMTGPNRPSPRKPSRRSSSPPKAIFGGNFNVITIPPPPPPTFTTDSPKKRPVFSTFDTSTFLPPQKALFTTFQSAMGVDKENRAPADDPFARGPDAVHAHKGPLKRPLMDPAPIRDRPPKKAKVEEPVDIPIPEPADMPAVEDDGNKPPYSYAMLIGMAILRAPNRRLTLAQIYKWISDSFEHYRTVETGWQNSIRHNLSLNKAFVKQERPKDDPGKGNYWAIAAGSEGQFVREKHGRRTTSLTIPPRAAVPPSVSAMAAAAAATMPEARGVELPTTGATPSVPAAADPSSEATILASDAATQENESPAQRRRNPPPSTRAIRSSPPPINSSPPITRHRPARAATPPSVLRIPPPSGRSRKRKWTALNDSGYYSSIDSSVRRPHTAAPASTLFTSEADLERPRPRSGRAEEEIARMRQSSYESPSKLRTMIRQPTPQLASSSPVRHFDSALLLPPLTPATTFKVPPKPPRSISPNTNLRNHRNKIRELVGSPLRGLSCLQEETPWSPAFKMDESFLYPETLEHLDPAIADDLDLFGNNTKALLLSGTAAGSPEKRSVKRPRLDRANTTAGVLADITNSGNNALVSATTPVLQFPFLRSPAFSRSPSKSPTPKGGARAPNWAVDFDSGLFVDDDDTDLGGLGIQHGLLSGADAKAERSHNRKTTTGRPNLGRSSTSQF